LATIETKCFETKQIGILLTFNVLSFQARHLVQLHKTSIQNYSLSFCYAKGKWGQHELCERVRFGFFFFFPTVICQADTGYWQETRSLWRMCWSLFWGAGEYSPAEKKIPSTVKCS